MSINVIFCFVLLLALNSSVDSIEFCKAFRENNDKISYVLRSDIPNEPNIQYVTGYNFIINGNKWLAKFKEVTSVPKMGFNGYESQSTPFFSGYYQMAVWLWFKKPNDKKNVTLFPRENWKNLTFGWTQNEKDIYNLDQYNQKLSLELPLILSSNVKKPKIIIQENDNEMDPNSPQTLIFIYQDSLEKLLTVKRFIIEYKKSEMKIIANVSEKTPKYLKGLKEFIPKYELIGVIPQWTHYNSKYSFVYLFVDNLKIRWCVSEGEQIDKNWCQKNPTILIDCISAEKPTTPTLRPSVGPSNSPTVVPSVSPTVNTTVSPTVSTTVSPNVNQTQVTEKDAENYMLIAMIVIIVVVIIILIAIAIYLCRSLRKESTTELSAQSTLPKKDSTEAGANPSKQSSQKKGSTISSNFGSKK